MSYLELLPAECQQSARLRFRGKGGRKETYCLLSCPQCLEPRQMTVYNAYIAYCDGRVCNRCKSVKGYESAVAKWGRLPILKAIAKRALNEGEFNVYQALRVLLYARQEGMKPQTVCALNVRYQVITPPFVYDNVIYLTDSDGVEQVVGIVEVNGYWHNQTRQDRDSRVELIAHCKVLFVSYEDAVGDKPQLVTILNNYLDEVLS